MRTMMKTMTIAALMGVPLVCYADSSYEHTTQITGGQLINTLKHIPFMGKQMKALADPMSEITMVHGNQKAIVSKDYTEITDLDKETITHIDTVKKTYSVMTFADMRKAIEEMPAKMQEMQDKMKAEQAKAKAQPAPNNLKYTFSVDVKDTGLTKMVDKYNAKQQIMTMKTTVTDTTNPDTKIEYAFTDEIWTTADVPSEMKEVEEFDKRFIKKMMQGVDTSDVLKSMSNMRNSAQASMSQMFGMQPGAGESFEAMGKELAKIKGTRVMEITRMGGSGTGIQAQPGDDTPMPSGNQVAGQVASDTAKNTTSAAAGSAAGRVGGIGGVALGSAVSGALGGVFGHKKAKPPDPPPAAAAPAAGTVTTSDVTLMEMTVKTHDFSSEAVPSSVFVVPAGYKQVESQMQQMMDKK
jgi:hypothetical protein